MLITGALFYNHNLNNKEYFVYNGELMEKTDKEFLGNIDDFKFSDRAFELDWDYGVDEFENICDELDIDVSIYRVELTDSEKQVGIDYLNYHFPITFNYAGCTFDDLLPYDFSERLSELMVSLDIYFNPTQYIYPEYSLYYEFMTEMLIDNLECTLSNGDMWNFDIDDMLNYAQVCFDHALNNHSTLYGYMPEFERTFPDLEYYLKDNKEFQEMYNNFNKAVELKKAQQDIKSYLK